MRAMRSGAVPLIPFLVLVSGCATTLQPIPADWSGLPAAPRIRSLALGADGKVTYPAVLAPRRVGDNLRVNDGMLLNGDKVLTERFAAIDSFSFSEARGEVAFSARRKDNFDVGLVSSDGSPVNWVPEDPADEVDVQWAPRGSKISYVIRVRGGDVVRSLHVPTAASLSVPFPLATIHALAWDPQAERYAVSYSTPDASDRVDVLEYDGDAHRTVIEPAAKLDVEVEPFAAGSLLLRPRDLLYDEKVPVVVWVGERPWNDARAALIRGARVAVIILDRSPADGLRETIERTSWMDSSRLFVVHASAPLKPLSPEQWPGATFFLPDAGIAGGRYRVAGRVVSAAPRDIQSVAAGFIADQLKRTSPPNGSSR